MEEIVEALIFAGGKGERLRPLTHNTPKVLVEVHGVPILSRQTTWLRKHGVRRVVIACGYLSEKIDEYVRSNDLGVEVELSVEPRRLGTGGALNLALGRLLGDTFFVLNGDIISAMDLTEIGRYHREKAKTATIVVVPFISPYGIVTHSDGVLKEFKEKPALPYWVNAGIYVIDRRIEPLLPAEGSLEADVFSKMSGDIAVYESRDVWIPIDTVKDLREAEAFLSRAEI